VLPPHPLLRNACCGDSARLRRRQGAPAVFLNPADAGARGIVEGDAVVVRTARGESRFAAHLTEDTRAGVIVIEGIWWAKHQAGGRNVNALTDDRVADMGGGPVFHSNLAEVTRLVA